MNMMMKKANESVWREVMCNILTETDILMKMLGAK